MDIKLYQRTQRDLAATVNEVIDTYWQDKIAEKEMIESIQKLYVHNQNKFIKNGYFTTVIQQQCGKRRLEVIAHVIKNTENSGSKTKMVVEE